MRSKRLLILAGTAMAMLWSLPKLPSFAADPAPARDDDAASTAPAPSKAKSTARPARTVGDYYPGLPSRQQQRKEQVERIRTYMQDRYQRGRAAQNKEEQTPRENIVERAGQRYRGLHAATEKGKDANAPAEKASPSNPSDARRTDPRRAASTAAKRLPSKEKQIEAEVVEVQDWKEYYQELKEVDSKTSTASKQQETNGSAVPGHSQGPAHAISATVPLKASESAPKTNSVAQTPSATLPSTPVSADCSTCKPSGPMPVGGSLANQAPPKQGLFSRRRPAVVKTTTPPLAPRDAGQRVTPSASPSIAQSVKPARTPNSVAKPPQLAETAVAHPPKSVPPAASIPAMSVSQKSAAPSASKTADETVAPHSATPSTVAQAAPVKPPLAANAGASQAVRRSADPFGDSSVASPVPAVAAKPIQAKVAVAKESTPKQEPVGLRFAASAHEGFLVDVQDRGSVGVSPPPPVALGTPKPVVDEPVSASKSNQAAKPATEVKATEPTNVAKTEEKELPQTPALVTRPVAPTAAPHDPPPLAPVATTVANKPVSVPNVEPSKPVTTDPLSPVEPVAPPVPPASLASVKPSTDAESKGDKVSVDAGIVAAPLTTPSSGMAPTPSAPASVAIPERSPLLVERANAHVHRNAGAPEGVPSPHHSVAPTIAPAAIYVDGAEDPLRSDVVSAVEPRPIPFNAPLANRCTQIMLHGLIDADRWQAIRTLQSMQGWSSAVGVAEGLRNVALTDYNTELRREAVRMLGMVPRDRRLVINTLQLSAQYDSESSIRSLAQYILSQADMRNGAAMR